MANGASEIDNVHDVDNAVKKLHNKAFLETETQGPLTEKECAAMLVEVRNIQEKIPSALEQTRNDVFKALENITKEVESRKAALEEQRQAAMSSFFAKGVAEYLYALDPDPMTLADTKTQAIDIGELYYDVYEKMRENKEWTDEMIENCISRMLQEKTSLQAIVDALLTKMKEASDFEIQDEDVQAIFALWQHMLETQKPEQTQEWATQTVNLESLNESVTNGIGVNWRMGDIIIKAGKLGDDVFRGMEGGTVTIEANSIGACAFDAMSGGNVQANIRMIGSHFAENMGRGIMHVRADTIEQNAFAGMRSGAIADVHTNRLEGNAASNCAGRMFITAKECATVGDGLQDGGKLSLSCHDIRGNVAPNANGGSIKITAKRIVGDVLSNTYNLDASINAESIEGSVMPNTKNSRMAADVQRIKGNVLTDATDSDFENSEGTIYGNLGNHATKCTATLQGTVIGDVGYCASLCEFTVAEVQHERLGSLQRNCSVGSRASGCTIKIGVCGTSELGSFSEHSNISIVELSTNRSKFYIPKGSRNLTLRIGLGSGAPTWLNRFMSWFTPSGPRIQMLSAKQREELAKQFHN